jgi:hypothetical protein
MGFLDRFIRGVNRAAEPVQNATPVERAHSVHDPGGAASGRVIGIYRRLHDETTRTTYLVEVTGSGQRFATEVQTTPFLHRLRLNLEVPVTLDGDDGIVDWPAMFDRWGFYATQPGQGSHRKLPAEGIEDTAHPRRARKLLERGRRTTATVSGLEWARLLGMPGHNWNLDLTLADGSTARLGREEVPPYAYWYTGPGAQLPVAVDDAKAGRVAVDWPAFTIAASTDVRLDDTPPPGSIAAHVEAEFVTPTPTNSVTVGGDTRSAIAAGRNAAQVSWGLQQFVGEVQAGRMKPEAFADIVEEWRRAGMCTDEEAAAARAAAGLG